jgi:4-hydroxybenzoate polyprenyltransferase
MIRIFRPVNLLLLAFTQFSLWYKLSLPYITEKTILQIISEFCILCCGTMIITAAGYLINDIYDEEIDKINKPDKLYIGKSISKKNALNIYIILNITALLLAVYLFNISIILIYLSAILLLYLYSAYLKKTAFWGNFTVALLSAAVVAELILYYQLYLTEKQLVFYISYCGFAFLTTLFREIVKDLEDKAGDEAHGAGTLAVILPMFYIRSILFIINFLLLISLIIAARYLFIGLNLSDSFAMSYWLFLLLIPTFFMFGIILRYSTKSQFAKQSAFLKIYMFLGLIWVWTF